MRDEDAKQLERIRNRAAVPPLTGSGPDVVLLTEQERDWLCTAAAAGIEELRRTIMLELEAEGRLKSNAVLPTTEEDRARIQAVYECWRQELYPTMPEQPSKDRFKIIAQALRAGYTVEQLQQIIRWARHDPWCSGRDPRTNGRRLDDLFTLIGSRRKIDRHLLPAQHSRGLMGREAGAALMPDAPKTGEPRRL